jgi:predicted aspartyl protease
MRRNVPVVPVQVDGATAQLILDTGAEHTVLLASFVDRIGLKRDFRHAMMIRGIGAAMATAVARPEEIRLGGLEVRRPFIIVGSFSTGNLPGGLPDGLLGADILAGFDVDIDVPQGRLSLYPACSDARPAWDTPYTVLPGRLQRGRFLIPLTLDGTTVPVAIDTGAEYSLISTRGAQAAGVGPAALARDPPTELAVVGPDRVTARVHRFGQLRLGSETYDAPVLPVIALPQGGLDGLLGMNYLRRHRVWLSYASGRVFVAPATAPRPLPVPPSPPAPARPQP